MMSSIKQSETSSTTPPRSDRDKVVQHLKSMGGIKRLVGLMGLESLEAGLEEQAANEAAENAAIRQAAWGYEQPPESSDEMGKEFVAGDKTSIHHHHHVAPRASSLGKLALAAAIGGPLGILAWRLTEPKPEPAKPAEVIHKPGTDRDWRVLEPIIE